MLRAIRHWHVSDYRLVTLIGTTLILLVIFLAEQSMQRQSTAAGWRPIDFDVVLQKIDSGELSDREADWYHQTE